MRCRNNTCGEVQCGKKSSDFKEYWQDGRLCSFPKISKKLMEEEVRTSVANQRPPTTFCTRFDARGNGRDTKPFYSTLRRYTFGGGDFSPSILVSTSVCARPLLLNMHLSFVCFPGQADMAEREASGVWTGHLPAAFSG